MRELLKYGLIAGGALYLFKDHIAGYFGSDEQPPVALLPAPGALPPAVINPPAYVPPPAAQPSNPTAVNPLPVTEELIKRASYDRDTAVILGARVLLSTHQWNWYRESAGKGNPGTDFTSTGGGDPAEKITALQYHAKLSTAGLAGLRGLRGLYANQWRQAYR